jgi:uncharacterized protein (TIGR02452 family)
MSMLRLLPCVDSADLALQRQTELFIPRERATALGLSAVKACRDGVYDGPRGQPVDWSRVVRAARESRVSLPPDAALPVPPARSFPETRVQVANETTLAAAHRLVSQGGRTIALNFANGVVPGGGFLSGARAQEEVLCRSSSLFHTLEGDPMYDHHRARTDYESTDWVIYSPDVPVFRTDRGDALETPWTLSMLTCAAPVASRVGQPRAAALMHARIRRVLAVAKAFGYPAVVLGAWGCGAFGNDATLTAKAFRATLEGECAGAFAVVVFAITDWSPERGFLGPFRDVFS